MKKSIYPQATALGGVDRSRIIVATVGDIAYIRNRMSGQLEVWRAYKGDPAKAPVMFIDGAAYIRSLDKQGERTLASTMVAA